MRAQEDCRRRQICLGRLGCICLRLGTVAQGFAGFHAASSGIAAARNTDYDLAFYRHCSCSDTVVGNPSATATYTVTP